MNIISCWAPNYQKFMANNENKLSFPPNNKYFVNGVLKAFEQTFLSLKSFPLQKLTLIVPTDDHKYGNERLLMFPPSP